MVWSVLFSLLLLTFCNTVLTASVTSKKTSCNVAGAPHVNTTNNGALSAVVTGGTLPYSYPLIFIIYSKTYLTYNRLNWSFVGGINANSTDLVNQRNLLSNIEVFGEDLNGTWADRSTGVFSLTASSMFRFLILYLTNVMYSLLLRALFGQYWT